MPLQNCYFFSNFQIQKNKSQFFFSLEQKRIQTPNRDQLDSSGSENQIRLIMIHSYKKPAFERFAKRMLNGQENVGHHQLIGAAGQTHPIFVKMHGNRRLVNGEAPIRSLAQQQSIAQLNNGQLNNHQTNNPQSNNHKSNNGGNSAQQSIQNMFSSNYQSTSNRFIPKLLLPKFTRPKMYSLNGFIPKPNIQKFTTTTISSLNVNSALNGLNQFQRNKSGRKSTDKQLDKVSSDETKRRKVGKILFFFLLLFWYLFLLLKMA